METPRFNRDNTEGLSDDEIATLNELAAALVARGCSPIAVTQGTASERRANARLIAAAPELLEALEALLMAVRCNAEGGRPRTADEIFAMAGSAAQFAIAKATGGASR